MPFETLILDFGDVLFDWTPPTDSAIPPRLLRSILTSSIWFEYERGNLTQEHCYSRVAAEFQVEVDDVCTAFKQARESLTPNNDLFRLVQSWKQASQETLRVFALSNISAPDFAYLRTLDAQWSIFDEVFVSCEIGERKPHLGIFKTVLQRTGSNPAKTVFVDDKLDNVLSAKSLGCRGVHFVERHEAFRELKTLFCDPVQRGHAFLAANAGRLDSVTNSGELVPEIFAQLLILEATGQRYVLRTRAYFSTMLMIASHLVKSNILTPEHDGTYRFFHGSLLLVSSTTESLT